MQLRHRPVLRRRPAHRAARPDLSGIKQVLGSDWTADCLTLCGYAADPVVTLTYHGSHADNFNDLVAQVSVNTDPVLAAWQDWGGKLTARHGQAWAESPTFAERDTLDAVAAKDFAAIRPTTVRVGANLPGEGP